MTTSFFRKVSFFSFLLVTSLILVACNASAEHKADAGKPFRVAVFVPGVVQGSPTYEMMVAGVEAAKTKAASQGRTIESKVVEGGFNQSEWQNALMALASGGYDLVISSNPSMPDIAAAVSPTVPDCKFLLMDGSLAGNPAIKTIDFDNYQQAWLNGYFAAMVSSSQLNTTPNVRVVGLLAGQEYPVMNNQIKKGFLDGAQAVNSGFTLDFRVLGNWYDAAKAAELSRSMIGAKAHVILAIAGGGNQGVVAAAKEAGTFVTWFDDPRYAGGEGTVIGSTLVKQTDACTTAILQAMDGKLDYGTPTKLGIKEGAVDFDFDNPAFTKVVPSELLAKERAIIDDVKAGKMVLAPKS